MPVQFSCFEHYYGTRSIMISTTDASRRRPNFNAPDESMLPKAAAPVKNLDHLPEVLSSNP